MLAWGVNDGVVVVVSVVCGVGRRGEGVSWKEYYELEIFNMGEMKRVKLSLKTWQGNVKALCGPWSRILTTSHWIPAEYSKLTIRAMKTACHWKYFPYLPYFFLLPLPELPHSDSSVCHAPLYIGPSPTWACNLLSLVLGLFLPGNTSFLKMSDQWQGGDHLGTTLHFEV